MRNSISRKILLGVVLSSTLVTMFVTLFQLHQNFESEIDVKIGHFDTLMHVNGNALKMSVWDLNEEQVDSIISGYLGHESVDYLELTYQNMNGSNTKTRGKNSSNFLSKKFELINEGEKIGTISFFASKDKIYSHVLQNLVEIILINAAKTFFVSFLILFIVNHLLTRHLITIGDFLQSSLKKDSKGLLSLDRINGENYHNDELTSLVSSINNLLVSIRANRTFLERKISERTKHLEEAKSIAEQATLSKSHFLANMSHEIRTPMNGIMSCSSILMDSKNLSKDEYKLVEIIHSCCEGLLVLINDILDLSKLESNKIDLEMVPFSVSECVSETLEIVKIRTTESNVELKANLDKELPPLVIGDVTRIKQILLNLLSNAVKFTEKGTVEVKITCEELDENFEHKVTFSVVDQGIGISEDARDKLFKRFSQVDESTTRRFGGSGLGLSISKGLVDLMGGRIWVESTEGNGSTFNFEIPLTPAPESLRREKPKDVLVHLHDLPKFKILVVEDNKINQMVLTKILEKGNHLVDVAENGKIAFEMSKANHYDFILMDQHMPVMDGRESTRLICAHHPVETRPTIIALTASAMKEDRDNCLAAGMDEFLTKPVQVKQLIAILRRYGKNKLAS